MDKAAKTRADQEVAGSVPSAMGSGASGSVPQQTKEVIEEGADVVQEKAQELRGTAGERVRQAVDTRSTEAGTQLQGTASAMRRTTEQLRQEGNEVPAKAMDFVAERTERLGSYLTGADADQVLRDVEAFARRQPWLVAVGGATVGFFAARFLKASSSARFNAAGSAGTGSRQPWQSPESAGKRPSVGSGAATPSVAPQSVDDRVLTAPRGSSNG
jgi:ElaB/YqjD/DUF883 family membrane-anchored ribosome-binding protein